MKLVHWPLMSGPLHLVQRGGDWVALQPARPPLALSNVRAHPSMASVPITVLLYIDPLLRSFNVPIKELIWLLSCAIYVSSEFSGRHTNHRASLLHLLAFVSLVVLPWIPIGFCREKFVAFWKRIF